MSEKHGAKSFAGVLSEELTEICQGLYLISAPPENRPYIGEQSLWVYFLLSPPSLILAQHSSQHSPKHAKVTLEHTWNEMSGWYIFIGVEVSQQEAPDFIEKAKTCFPDLTGTIQPEHALVWLQNQSLPKDIPAISILNTEFNFQVRCSENLYWSQLKLEFIPGSKAELIGVEEGSPVLRFSLPGTISPFQLFHYDSDKELYVAWPDLSPIGSAIQLYFSGLAAGSLNFPFGLSDCHLRELVAATGCHFKYIPEISSNGRKSVSDEIQFPMFDFTDVKGTVGFDFWLNPVLPTNFFATRLQLDVTNRSDNQEWATEAKAIASSYFFTTEGAPVKLSPYDPGTVLPVNGEIGAGFGFSKMQDQDISGLPAHFPSNLYLSPVGIFTLENIEADGKNSIIELMPGLYSQEFLRISEGTKIQFINDQPAYARSFSVSGSPSDSPPSNLDLLQNDYTTSWMQVLTEEGHYFGEPSSGSFFIEQDGGPFSNSVDARLATLSNSTAFPCVPLGGIFSAPSPLNSEQISRFEATILSSARHGQLTLHSEGPVFLPGGSLLGPSSMLSSTTPQGLLIELNDDGSWNKVVLAKQPAMLNADPPIPETQLQFLSYGSPPKFPADLSLILTQNQLFFIVTEPSECWSFDSTIFLSGFQFELGFDSENPDAQLIMIFKFNTTASVAELVANPGLWTGAEHYNSDPEATSALIDDYITFAQQRVPGDPFEHFNNLVNDPAWTGVLFLNTGINGNGMPADLQMLLGGVNGPLRAHHLGIQGNMMDVEAKSGKLEIDQSSLFGVIFYNGNGQPSNPDLCDTPVDYETETLVVVFSNSSITQFNTSVGLTLNQLMGRDVQLIHPPVDSKMNTISIKGQYQAGSDGVGRMTFISEQKFKYKFIVNDPNIDPVVPNVRVLEKVEFNQASLVPVSSQPVQEKGTTEVRARFSLSGALWFCPNPFPDSDQLDLFSYGCKDGPDVGLAISNLSVDVDFTLNEVGITVPDSKRVTLDLTAMTADPSTDAIRPNSLLFSIPLKFSRFIVGEEEAINATNTGSTAVNILQLESNPINADSLVQPALLDSPDQAASPPSTYVTSAPRYALEYDMLLGSLGALGADAKLEAKVLLAWGPSSTIPDNDAAALFIQLPQLSAGAGGFELEGVLKTAFGDANLLKVDLENGSQTVYAILFNNVQLSAFGYSFPPGIMVDFTVFAGTTTPGQVIPTYANNLAWFLSAKPEND